MNLLYKSKQFLLSVSLLISFGLITQLSVSQTIVSTASGTNFTGANAVAGISSVTFVIQNTTAVTKVLSQVDMFSKINESGSVRSLWVSTTSLSGAATIASPVWTLIATGQALTITADGVIPNISGFFYSIPPGAQYRFAVQSTNGISYSGAAGPPAPNTFSNGGINLKVYDAQIAGLNVGYAGAFPTPTFVPRAFTGRLIFDPAPCTGTPAPGNTLASVTNACASVPFTLSLQNDFVGITGLVYQWQSSPDGITWTDILTATGATYTTTQTAATRYRARVSCGVNTGTSTPISLGLNTFINCYCAAGATNTAFEKISNVTIGAINNPSTSTAGYEDFSTLSTTLARTGTAQISVSLSGGFAFDQVIVFIDFNQNGSFADAGETVYTSLLGAGPHVGIIIVPATALLGTTKMRVRMHDTSLGPNATSCGNSSYGQVEDYSINIINCAPGAIATQPANRTITCGTNATFTLTASGTGITYQWQERVSSTAPWTTLANGGVYSGVTTATLTLTNLPVTYSGYQYRAVIAGTCTPTDISAAATLTVSNLIANVTPVAATICVGSIQPLSIISTAPPVTQTINSAPLSIAIPDGNVAGINTNLSVSGIPATAIVTGVSVRLSITHTYVSDLVIILRAPNGNIFNLSYLVTRTNGPGANFVNTVISSAGTAALNTGAAPYTGTFAPDGQTTTFFTGVPTGPTGFVANVAAFSGLYSVPNGTWTLAMYDAGAPDVGILTSWSLNITYGAPFSGVWSPITGLFTDAAATVPYTTGTLVNTVYAKPTTTTNYSVVINSANCTSPATVIPVTVNTPVTGAAISANTSICTNGNTSFTASATAGSPLTYQWQVSTDNGTTFNNVTNGANYGGATTTVLAITSAPLTWNGYRYRAIITAGTCGSVNTPAATLTVRPLPVISIAAAPYTKLYPGIKTTLTATPVAGTFAWFKNGTAVTGATGSSITVDIDGLGDYTATSTDGTGCSSLLSNTVSITDSISTKLFIFPNPNTGQFQVRYYSLPGNKLNRSLTIYNAKGAKVYSSVYAIGQTYGQMDVNLSNLGKGVYFVELGDFNGNRIKVERVVIQ